MKPRKDAMRKSGATLAPVIDLKSKKEEDDSNLNSNMGSFQPVKEKEKDSDWGVEDEYDPMFPNDYEKVEEEEEEPPTPQRTGGAAIAPPPSLQEANSGPGSALTSATSYGASVAAKIMAKYGFREGQGLGKKEQGIASALQVEKTSKRGGRIIRENDVMPPPTISSPGAMSQVQPSKPEPTITEIMKSPSKVVLLRNMVGPGEVDEDLEPEVKDECNTKYGDVIKVIIFEQPNVPHEEAVRIFVEFKRIESAIKGELQQDYAVVDLNGRFFGGRQVKAGFYSWEKLNNLQLLELTEAQININKN
uniref:Splicing factor 45 n=1 Tax=Timema shepardi TaxID=629360 RepID=A0A7R9APR8_TIMSH|nr:unnamed protein product [Timema shepardi]